MTTSEMTTLIVSFALLILTGIAAAAAVVQARVATRASSDSRAARDDARTARDEARDIALTAASALQRQADAEERANELRVAALPVARVEWQMRKSQSGRDSWEVRNVGDLVAYAALARPHGEGVLHADESAPRDVEPGDGLGLLALSTAAGPPTVRLTWNDPDGTAREWVRVVR